MSGAVTYQVYPCASSVIVGDNSTGSNPCAGQSPCLAAARQAGVDDLDDGTPAGKAKADAYVKSQIAAGIFNQASIDKGNAVVPKEIDDRPAPVLTGTSVDCAAIHQSFNLGTKLSATTTLGDFINKLPLLPNCKLAAVPAQMGLRPDEIVCNLANLCANVWEPLRAKYPNAAMTNNLRTGSNIGAGPHGTGQAMDIQFNNSDGSSISPSDYYAIAVWIKNNIAFDQLILEYHTARGPLVAWIHCSIYAGTGKPVTPQNKILTMMNGSVKYTSLANLAN